MEDIALHIVSPEGVLVQTRISSVTLPGRQAPFQVLRDHAPLLSSLTDGDVVYTSAAGTQRLHVRGGFVEVRDNQVHVCVEV